MKPSHFIQSDEVRTYNFGEHNIQIGINKDTFPPSNFTTSLINRLEINKGEAVLDVGCGTGIIGIYAAKNGANVYATDISKHAIEQAKINATSNEVTINFSQGAYFADYKNNFNKIVANLPQSMIPTNQSPIESHLLSTIKGGAKGNEILLDFLQVAKQRVDKQTLSLIHI